MMTKLISGTDLQLLRRYDNRPESYRAQLLDDVFKPNHSVLFCSVCICLDLNVFLTLSFIFKPWQDGPAYVRVFVTILRDIFKEETVEYVLALIDEMLAGINSCLLIFLSCLSLYVSFSTSAYFSFLLAANPKRARLFHDKSLANDDPYEPFLS